MPHWFKKLMKLTGMPILSWGIWTDDTYWFCVWTLGDRSGSLKTRDAKELINYAQDRGILIDAPAQRIFDRWLDKMENGKS